MLAEITLLGSEPQVTEVITGSSTVIPIPLIVVGLVALYFVGLWTVLFIDGIIDVGGEGRCFMAILWPLVAVLLAFFGIGVLFQYLYRKSPGCIKRFLFYISLPFRPVTAGKMFSEKLDEKKKTTSTLTTDKYWATFGEDGKITSLRRNRK